MAAPTQKGTQLVAKAAPTFENFVVVDKTWRESDPLAIEEILDGNSETLNETGSNPGIDAECEWVIKSGETPAKKLDIVVATFADATTKSFTVQDVTTSDFGGRPLKQSVKLKNRTSMDYDEAPETP